MFEALKQNIAHEKRIIRDMNSISAGLRHDPQNSTFYLKSFNALLNQLRMLNKSIPELLGENPSLIKSKKTIVQKTKVPQKKQETVSVSFVSPRTKEKSSISLNKEDRKSFLKELRVSEDTLKKITRSSKKKESSFDKKPQAFARFSNKFFFNYSRKLVPKFSSLSSDMKKANLPFLTSTYLSMALMGSLLAFLGGLIVFGIFLFIDISNWAYAWIPLGSLALVAMGFYFYPASEASSVQKAISQELPFATIHMAAVASSNIEPVKIFEIISRSKEYPHVGREIRKVLNQVYLYGYDLLTALKNVAIHTPNKQLAELFSGIATNIGTGGALKNYLGKKADNFLIDYRLERQKYADLAGTFMDVYISILIAAPLVLMMMFIVMNVSGLGIGGIGITTLLFISVGAIIFINIIFLFILNIKQPSV